MGCSDSFGFLTNRSTCVPHCDVKRYSRVSMALKSNALEASKYKSISPPSFIIGTGAKQVNPPLWVCGIQDIPYSLQFGF